MSQTKRRLVSLANTFLHLWMFASHQQAGKTFKYSYTNWTENKELTKFPCLKNMCSHAHVIIAAFYLCPLLIGQEKDQCYWFIWEKTLEKSRNLWGKGGKSALIQWKSIKSPWTHVFVYFSVLKLFNDCYRLPDFFNVMFLTFFWDAIWGLTLKTWLKIFFWSNFNYQCIFSK